MLPLHRRCFLLAFLGASSLLQAGTFRGPERDRGAVREAVGGLLNLSRNPLMLEAVYRNPHRIRPPRDIDAATGAAQGNRQARGAGDWFIEAQRWGGEYVQAGLLAGDKSTVEAGKRMIAWGLSRQGGDGSFPGSGDPWHSTSLFVESFARATLLLEESGQDPTQVKAWKTALARSIRWMRDPVMKQRQEVSQGRYTHRRWVFASTFAMALRSGVVEGREAEALWTEAAWYAREAMACQTSEGWYPEMGKGATKGKYLPGIDVSYHGLGLLHGVRFAALCQRDPALKAACIESLLKGADRLCTRVGLDGSVDESGSNRVGRESTRDGILKKMDRRTALNALALLANLVETSHPAKARIYAHTARLMAQYEGWVPPVRLAEATRGFALEIPARKNDGLTQPFRLEGEAVVHPASSRGGTGSVAFTFLVPKQGRYRIAARCYWERGSENSFQLSVDSSPREPFGNDEVFGTWHWVKSGKAFCLEKGEHRVVFFAREKGARLDRVGLLEIGD